MLAVIPYETFPEIAIGPIELRTFGLMVGVGVLLGAWLAARYIEMRTGIDREETYRLATRMVIFGIIGARLTWVLSHTDDLDSPLDVIAVWEGGLQFSGGFIAAVLVGLPVFRRWDRNVRWANLDGYAWGLTIGLAIGRIGCISVGEHFGRHSSWLLAVRYEGGSVREPTLGDDPLIEGVTTFHHTALYELIYLLVLFAALTLLIRRPPRVPGAVMGAFCLSYGVLRFLSDALRVNDERVLMLTGAQWLCLALIPTGLWILFRVRPRLDPLDRPAVLAEEAPEEAPETPA